VPIGASLALGLILLAMAAAFFRAVEISAYAETQGQVIRLDSHGETRAPIVSYRAPGYGEMVVTGTLYINPPRYAVGDRITVWYSPKDPTRGVIADPLDVWIVPGGLGVGGIAFGAIALLVHFSSKSTRRSS
jgi:hypothetical protein